MITDVVPDKIPVDKIFIPAIAEGLASLGRFEDTYMVHAAKGETVVPKAVLDANPGLRENLFQQMVDMGIENPERYVVGESLNSINPVTGQPEFFFDSIKKFFKKAAPVIGGAIGGYFGGPIGAAAGAGLGSKAAGQPNEQALMAAALSGATSYMLGAGTSNVNAAGVPITDAAAKAAAREIALGPAGNQAIIQAGTIAPQGMLQSAFTKGVGSIPTNLISQAAIKTGAPGYAIGAGLGGLGATLMAESGAAEEESGAARAAAQAQRREVVGAGIRDREIAKGNRTLAQFPGVTDIKDLTPEQLALIRETGLNQRPTLSNQPARVIAARPSAQEQAIINQMLAGIPVAQPQFPLDVELQDITPTRLNANQGTYVPGNQTQNKDSVPAMLTPGEFVFTRDAVRGAAPNGTRQQQAQAMYKMMRGLEGRA